jgi:glucose-1-phosphate thymidylyltransferase
MKVTRAVVLARGLGTRMRSVDAVATLTDAQRRAADAGMKAMMPIAGRPFLDFVLSTIADAGLRQVGIVVAPDHDALREHYGSVAPPARLTVDLLVQHQPLGTADAVLAAESWTREQPFLVMNGDNLYPAAVLRDLAALDEPGLPGFDADDLVRSSNIEPSRIRAFALVEVDHQGYLARIVEKPPADQTVPASDGRVPGRACISMNCWRFDRQIFAACRDVPRSPRGELELPAAVGLAASLGMRFKVLPASGPVLDLSQRADAAEVSRRLAGIVPRP